MRHILFLLFMALTLQAIAQYPATGNKMRLGWQTTGDGLVYRGAIGDTATLDPSGINNAWMLLDTANGNLYAYRAKAWRLVSGGGGSVSDTLTGEVKGPLDSTYIDTVANIIFRLDSTTVGVGEVKYNDTQGSIQQGLKGGNVTNVIGQQIHQRVTNATGAPLTKGTAVFLHGSQGNRITVRKALATVDSTSANTFGIVAESIANNQSGYVITEGLITNMNTNALTEGAAVYLSPTVAGELTTTKPQAPQHTVYIGVCVKQNAGSGELFVKIRNGQELDELHDVRITSPASNASLYYNAAQGIWRDTGAAVLVADTSAMLSPYLKKADTTSLSNRINLKLNISDTSAMLTNYINVVDTAAMLTNYINIADTATMLSSYISNADTSVFARDFQISGTANRLAMFTGSNTVGNAPMSIGGDTLNIITNAGFPTFRYNRDFSISSNTFAGWPVGTRFYSLLNSTSFASVSFGDGTNGTVQNQAFMQLTSWTGGGANFYSSRLINNNTGDLGFYLSSLGSNANPTMSATPHLMILNGGNVGIGTASPLSTPVGIGLTLGTTSSGRSLYMVSSSDGNNGLIQFKDQNGADALQIAGTSTSNFLYGYGSRPLSFFTNVTERMRIDASGNVGIGTASPGSYLLNLRDSIGFSGNGMYFSSTNGGTANPGGHIIGTKRGSWGTRIDFVARDAAGSLTETVMSIDGEGGGGGNVGINTSSPSRPLHVNANSSMIIPSGATGTRPASGASGDLRYSTTFNNIEFYDGSRGLWERPLVGTVATNKVAFALGDTLTSNTNFHWDNATTKLGIGNATPDSTLTVTGGIRTTTSISTNSDATINNIRIGKGGGNVSSNIVIGLDALVSNTSGGLNIAIGNKALRDNLTAGSNSAIGGEALMKNTTGIQNTAIASYTLSNNTTGSNNTAIGSVALYNNTGSSNTAIGAEAMRNNTTGTQNTAISSYALFSNTTSSNNTAVGSVALYANTGSDNSAIGAEAMRNSTTGIQNTAVGSYGLFSNTTGSNNTAVGSIAMYNNTTGSNNTAIGVEAGRFTNSGTNNQTSTTSIYIGNDARPSASGNGNEIVIGYQGRGNGSNTTTIGNSSTTKTFFQYGETYIGTATDNGAYNLQVGGNIKATGNISRKSAIVTTSNYTVLDEDTWITCVGSNRITLTLPSASTWPGREIVVQTGTAFGVVSNSSNVYETSSVYSFADTSIIKADYPYAWVKLVSDGTGWIKIQRSPYIITKSITLDFPAVAAQSSYTFSNTFVGGASIGDVVSIGVPSGMPANTIFTGQVSTTDGTVDIKMHNYGTTTTANPPSATFKIAITKF